MCGWEFRRCYHSPVVSDNNFTGINRTTANCVSADAATWNEDHLGTVRSGGGTRSPSAVETRLGPPQPAPSLMSTRPRTQRRLWWGLLLALGGVTAVAVVPPLLAPEWRAVVMHVFAPACHQLPGRSPTVGGVPIALCDRCAGIYLGGVLGILASGWGGVLRGHLPVAPRHILLASLVPLGLDWMGPILGLWPNGPWSRAATGLLFGGVAAGVTAARLLRAVGRERASGADAQAS